MVGSVPQSWSPDLHLPARGKLQEFVTHERDATLRIVLQGDERALVEVNDRVVAETEGFRSAAALAQLYTRSHEILLVERSGEGPRVAAGLNYFHIRAAADRYEVCMGRDPLDFVYQPERFEPIARSATLVEAIDLATRRTAPALRLAFADQEQIYRGLGQSGAVAVAVAAWTSRWRTPFVNILREQEFAPLFLSVAKAPDGAYYTIYRLADRRFLAELRSHHDAEQIGAFAALDGAYAYCDLFNAARHSRGWVGFALAEAGTRHSRDGAYLLRDLQDGCELQAADCGSTPLGRFAGLRLAEAYATAHRDALEHFRLPEQ